MMKHTAFVVLVALATAAGLSACAPAVPANPTWKDDVHPLMVARCVRCHDSPGRADPLAERPMVPAPFSLNFQSIDDPAAAILISQQTVLSKAIRGQMFSRRMPPPPAEPLADWEMQIIDNWTKENPLK